MMGYVHYLFSIVLILSCQNSLSFGFPENFETNVDSFLDAFNDAYSTEINSLATEEVSLSEENDITAEGSLLAETSKPDVEGSKAVQEEPFVAEEEFMPGGEVIHVLNDEVRTLAEQALKTISGDLRLVRVVEAKSRVEDKVRRSLSLVVAPSDCQDGGNCEVSCHLEIDSDDQTETVTWHNCLDKPANNEVFREKRGAIGGFKQVDDEEAKELAEVAIQTLDSIDADDVKRVVTEVIKAQKQLVNGILYHLTLEVASSDCKEDSVDCTGKLSDYSICKVLMQRLFSGDAPHNAQVIKSECTPITKAKEVEHKKKVKRHAGMDDTESNTIQQGHTSSDKPKTKDRFVGNKRVLDTKSDTIQEIANFALEAIDKTTNSPNKQKIVRIVHAQSQGVAGVKYFINFEIIETDCAKESDQTQEECQAMDNKLLQSCNVVVWDKPWKKFRAVTRVHCAPVTAGNRSKRESTVTIPGAPSEVDVNDARVQLIAHFALAQLDAASNSVNKQHLVHIKKATIQPVAGTVYNLILELVETDCPKSGGSDVQGVCNPLQDKKQECEVVVWDRPWLERREITSSKCSVLRPKRAFGGKKDADPNDTEVQKMARFAVEKLATGEKKKKLVEVKKAQTQLVAGTNYFLTLQLVETDCNKDAAENAVCNAAKNAVPQQCDVVVYSRPWEKHTELSSVKCNAARRKRQVLVGGLTPQDKDSVEIKDIANFAIADYNLKATNSIKNSLVEVVSAGTQVVAGVKYVLKLRVAEANCEKSNAIKSEVCTPKANGIRQECDVEVWVQAWLNKREVTKFECTPIQQHQEVADQPGLPGGPFPQNKDSDEIKEIANFALADYNGKATNSVKQSLVDIVSSQKQVVAGLNYVLKLRVTEADCEKSNAIKSAVCTPKANSVHQECDVVVWVQAWLNKREVTKFECTPIQQHQSKRSTQLNHNSHQKKTLSKRASDQAVAELKPIDTNDPEVVEAAKFSLPAIDRASNSIYKHAIINILEAKVQTVSGKKYHLRLRIGESECTKRHSDINCPLRAENSLNEECRVTVWVRPWLNEKKVSSVNCGYRRKRSTTISVPDDDLDINLASFEAFKTKYNKSYDNKTEEQKRFRIFRANLKKIEVFQENEQGSAIYGPNMFADLTYREFRQKYLGLKAGPPPKPSANHMRLADIPDVALPTDFDWRDHNVVTPVKSQGQCGSCWAFSVTGNVEGQWALRHGHLYSLSEQELVDCDKMDNGCEGGYMTQAYEAIEKLGGLETEDEYSYDAEDESCKFNRSEVVVTVSGSLNITSNETQIAQWLFKNGPISIGLNANAMQFYMGGVSHPFKFLCNPKDLDHGVLLVGFGVHRTSIRHKLLPYWLIKNSWGPHWGDKGYYRLYRGDGTCGVNLMASSAVVG